MLHSAAVQRAVAYSPLGAPRALSMDSQNIRYHGSKRR